MNTLLNMPQQLCSQCGGRNEGLLLPNGGMSKEAQHVSLLLCLCVTAIVHGLQQGRHLFKPKTADWRNHAAETPRPSELCFAWFMLTNWLLPFLSHICLLVALLRVFFFPFFAKVNHQGQKPLYTILCTPRVKWEKWGWSL